MVLEASVICVDNSEWMRNGDYYPSRLDAQQDAANLVANAKLQSNPESSCALLTMSGKRPRVRVNLCTDLGKIFTALTKVEPGGKCDLIGALQVAHLALKVRPNKLQRPRIVVFVGSPVDVPAAKLTKLGKLLKKNGISVDVVNFGETEANAELLRSFVDTVNSSGNCHLVTVPSSRGLNLADSIITSPVLMGEDTAPAGTGGGGGGGGAAVDPNVDPELALAMELSLQSMREEEQANAASANAETGDVAPMATDDAETQASTAPMDEDEQLRQAMAMSVGEDPADLDVEAQIQLAIQMSMADNNAQDPTPDAEPMETDGGLNEVAHDAGFLSGLLAQLPGVNPNDPSIQEVLTNLPKDDDNNDGKNGEGESS